MSELLVKTPYKATFTQIFNHVLMVDNESCKSKGNEVLSADGWLEARV